jgi:hypothetical protein
VVEASAVDADAGERKGQGLTLVHFSAKPEPFLTQQYLRHRLIPPDTSQSPPKRPLNAPRIPHQALTLSRKVDKCKPLARGGGPAPATLRGFR